jgi:hypothetical protein
VSSSESSTSFGDNELSSSNATDEDDDDVGLEPLNCTQIRAGECVGSAVSEKQDIFYLKLKLRV